jgi:hypothetical protein
MPDPTYTILTERGDGHWTDYLGPGDNTWPSTTAATQAITKLEAIGFTGPWAIVQTSTLPFRDLVA